MHTTSHLNSGNFFEDIKTARKTVCFKFLEGKANSKSEMFGYKTKFIAPIR